MHCRQNLTLTPSSHFLFLCVLISGGRLRGRSSIIHTGGGTGGLLSKPRVSPHHADRGLSDVLEDSSSPAARGHRTSVIKTPRARDITSGGVPAYMRATAASQQRLGHQLE